MNANVKRSPEENRKRHGPPFYREGERVYNTVTRWTATVLESKVTDFGYVYRLKGRRGWYYEDVFIGI